MNSNRDSLLKKADQIAKVIRDFINDGKNFKILAHHDADGISSASILVSILAHFKTRFHAKIIMQLNEKNILNMFPSKSDVLIFLDFGSGYKDVIRNVAPENDIIIIDHHETSKFFKEDKKLIELNPHLFNLNGSYEISSAGLAFLIAEKAIPEGSLNLSVLAIVGAIGDRQDRGEMRSLTGINSMIVQKAENAGLIKCKLSLRLFGAETRPLIKSLEYTTDPFIPGLSGDEGACYKFLKNIGIEPKKSDGKWKTLNDLNDVEKSNLTSNLIKHMISKGMEPKEAESIIGYTYIVNDEPPSSPLRDIREFSSLLNACGRMGKGGLGIAVCMKHDKAIEEANQLIVEYRRKISSYIAWLFENPERIKKGIYIQSFHGGSFIEDSMIGTMISVTMNSCLFSQNKVIIAFANSDGQIKVSARSPSRIIGINIGSAVQEAAEKVGGKGGGHDIAAGAFIPIGTEERFLQILDELIGKQLGGKNYDL
ncbi:MAG: DHH family phosphoesterase [Candidatus Methanomethylicia archaeon]